MFVWDFCLALLLFICSLAGLQKGEAKRKDGPTNWLISPVDGQRTANDENALTKLCSCV